MSDPALPDDVSKWPDDPYELFGVPHTVAPRDLKRAYTRLIRAYKPEQFPEQFRRIRAAYETILRFAELFGRVEESSPPADEPAVRPEPPPVAEDLPPSPPAPPPDDLDAIWERAINGDEAGAYAALRDAHQRHPGRPGVLLRLYWLLALNPALDSGRSPCDWLAEGLRANGLAGPLAELYRRELADDPAEVASDRCARLLDVEARPGPLADFAVARWQAAARQGWWYAIAEDLPRLRPRIATESEDMWLRLLLAAVDELIWVTDEAAARLCAECVEEVWRHGHLTTRLSGEFDRIEYLQELSKGWRRLRAGGDVPAAFLDLIPLSWTRPYAETLPALRALLAEIRQVPEEWLARFDTVAKHWSVVLSHFGGLLAQFEERLEFPAAAVHGPDGVSDIARDFLDLQGPVSYPNYRVAFLRFCLREVIPPERVAEVAPERPAHWPAIGVSLPQAIAGDWPLRYIAWACRLADA